MKVLGINGSPRKGGNTEILLNNALFGAKTKGASVECLTLNDLRFAPCQECEKMPENGICLIKDSMGIVYEKVLAADAVIVASPVFFGSVSAQLKAMIDRFQCVWLAQFEHGKKIFLKARPGAFICVEASARGDFFDNSRAVVKNLFATIAVKYNYELLVTNLEKKGIVNQFPDALEKAYRIGEDVVAVSSASGKKNP